jgi:Na+/melibiose symporter-like transporter
MLIATDIRLFYTGCLLWGIGQGLFYPYLWAHATMLCSDVKDASRLISLTTVSWYLAVGVTSFIYGGIAVLFQNDTHQFSFIVTLAAFVVLFLYRLLLGAYERKQDFTGSETGKPLE